MTDKWQVGVQSLPRSSRLTPVNTTTFESLDEAIDEFMAEVTRSLKFLNVDVMDNTSLGDLYREFISDKDATWEQFREYLVGDPEKKIPPAHVLKAVTETDCYMWMHTLSRVPA